MIPTFREVRNTAGDPDGFDLQTAKTKASERGLNSFDCVIFACKPELPCRPCAHRFGLQHPSRSGDADCGIRERTGAFIADALRQGTGGDFDCVREVFSDIPAYCADYVCAGSKPVYGVDIDEKAVSKYPYSYGETAWTQCRTPDRALHAPGFFKGNSVIELILLFWVEKQYMYETGFSEIG